MTKAKQEIERCCPMCGWRLFEKDGRRWCRHGCSILTAAEPRVGTDPNYDGALIRTDTRYKE